MKPACIDRASLVGRHNPTFFSAHPADVLTLGNGNLAMTIDCSGLQTFPEFHELRPDPRRVAPSALAAGLPPQPPRPYSKDDFQIPLRTQSSWGWYETPGRSERNPDLATTEYWNGHRAIPYLDRMGLYRPGDEIPEELSAAAWLHFNPRRLHLGRLALSAHGDFEAPRGPQELEDKRLALDLYSGTATAEYVFRGERVRVTAAVDPERDLIAARIESALLKDGLAIEWLFEDQKDDLARFEEPPATSTAWTRGDGTASALRRVGTSTYRAEFRTTGQFEAGTTHGSRVLAHTSDSVLELVVRLSEDGGAGSDLPSAEAVFSAAEEWWARYWESGAAVSFKGSTASEAVELERRIVLSQYLTAVNCAGTTPPQETGLTLNSWSGKFHLEMHWWHAAHFALWGRPHLLERSLDWYHQILPTAREHARKQGYAGARWPKQTSPSGEESPSQIGPFIIWQQPHIIHLLELVRVRDKGPDFVRKHLPLVEATAEFMADFVQPGPDGFELPPPLVPAQESYFPDRTHTANPTFELAYWAWALRLAGEWRALAGREPVEKWERVSEQMRRPTVLPDQTYAAVSTEPYLIREDHPSMLMAYGWLPPGDMIDPATMNRTLESVEEHWDLQSTWGWDYPVLSMTASRLGDLQRAISTLLIDTPKNHYLGNGHNPQRPGFLPIYLPANGGLLCAIAHIAEALGRGAELPEGWQMTAEGFRNPRPRNWSVQPRRNHETQKPRTTR